MQIKPLFSIITPGRRSIAAFRFVLGLGLLLDLSNRLANAPYFYGEQGLLPQALWERYYGDRAYYWTLHFFSQEWLFVAVLALQIGLALCLMLGYRVRLASALGWLLMLSLVLRNPLLFYGGDKLAPLLLLLSAFLPATSKAKWAAAQGRTPLLFYLSYAALLLQTAVLYIVSGESKLKSRYWQEGSALNNVLEMNLLVLPVGRWFGQFDPLLHLMSIAVPWAEVVLPLLFFLPFWGGRVRMVAVLGLLGLNLGVFLMLDVGYFMFYASACLIGLLPSVFWEDAGRVWRYLGNRLGLRRRVPRLNWLQRGPADKKTPSTHLFAKLGAGVASVLLFALMGVTLVTGLESTKLVNLSYPPGSWTVIRGINAYQSWGLFTDPGTTATWYVSKARLADGRWVDLLQEGEVVAWDYQNSPNALYRRNSKWRLAMAKISSFDDKQALLQAFGNALTARWEARQGDAKAVQTLTIYRLRQRLPATIQDPDWSEWLVWSQ